jgi:hypothetical protein
MPTVNRRSREELRTVLLEVGVSLLLERGLVGGAEHVTFSEVFAAAEPVWGSPINPASVYKRIWGTQADFQRDLLLSAASFYPDGEEQPTLAAARAVVTAADLRTPAARRRALGEVCRVAGEVHIRILEQSRPWQIWVGIWALTVSTPTTEDDTNVGPFIQVGHEKATDALQSVLEEVIPAVGYVIAEPYSWEQLALAIGALAEGMALRDRFATDRLLKINRNTTDNRGITNEPDTIEPGRESQSQSWTLFGVAVEALVLQMCIPLP